MISRFANRGESFLWGKPWPIQALVGIALAGCAVAVHRLQLLAIASEGIHTGVAWLNDEIGPVWVPMLAFEFRILQLARRAYRTRTESCPDQTSVAPELVLNAVLTVSLGFLGTVLGMETGFGALGDGDFLSKMPELLQSIGNAMASTGAGLVIAIQARLLAGHLPTWSWARITCSDGTHRYSYNESPVGRGTDGFNVLIQGLSVSRPEALRVVFDASVPPLEREELFGRIKLNHDRDHRLQMVVQP